MPFRFPSRKRPAPPSDNDQKLIPEVGANWYTLIVHGWIWDMVKIGFSRPLQPSDFWQLDEKRHVAVTGDKLSELFYSRCPNEVRPQHLRTEDDVPATKELSTEKAGLDEDETLRDAPSDPEKLFLDPFDRTTTYPAAMHATTISRRGSAVSYRSHLSVHHDLEREAAIDRETINVHLGSSSVFDAASHGRDGLSRITSRRAVPIRLEAEHDEAREAARRPKDSRYDENLNKAMLKLIWKQIVIAGLCYILDNGLRLGSTFATEALLAYITRSQAWLATPEDQRQGTGPGSVGIGISMAMGLAAMQMLGALADQYCMAIQREGAWILRASLWDIIAAKSFRLSPKARLTFGQGRITTSIAADCAAIEACIPYFDDLVYNLIIMAIGTGLLIRLLGASALAGVAVLTGVIPVKSTLGSAFFLKRIFKLRQEEIKQVKRNTIYVSITDAILTAAPVVATVVTFIVYYVTGHELTVPRISAALQIFGIISGKFLMLPYALSFAADAKVASDRIQRLLVAEEPRHEPSYNPAGLSAINIKGSFAFQSKDSETPSTRSKLNKLGIKARAKAMLVPTASAAKKEDSDLPEPLASGTLVAPFALAPIDLQIRNGALVCLCGRVGSGKTAFVQALLGAIGLTTGGVEFNGRIAYAQQVAFILSGSVRENILFGAPPDDDRLEQVIQACALVKDCEAFDYGIDTIVGENGVSLSGGRRSRIALARAVYSNADIIIMDDPLAAVNPEVAQHLLTACIHGILKNKTRILVTHSLEAFPLADTILCMQNGRIVQRGSFASLKSQRGIFGELLEEYGKDLTTRLEVIPDGASEQISAEHCSGKATPRRFDLVAHRPAPDIMEGEDRAEGSVSWHVYKMYFRYTGPLSYLAIITVMFFGIQGSTVASVVFLGFWTQDKFGNFRLGDYIAIYAAISLGESLLLAVQSPIMAWRAVRASGTMFELGLERVLRSSVRFHDQQPKGRLIARLSKDVAELDSQLAWQWQRVIYLLMQVIGSLALVIYSFKWLGFIFVPFICGYAILFLLYKRSGIEVKRLDNNARSFIYTAISEQLGGVYCIKAHPKQLVFRDRLRAAIDQDNRIFHIQVVLQRWLGVRTNVLGTILVLAVALFGVLARGDVSAATFGVVLIYTLNATAGLSQLLASFVQLEQGMNQTERLLAYTELPPEAERALSSDPDSSWPSEGRVEFDAVQVRYRPELPLVLKGISFVITPGSKVGIIGRTGAGKSSMLQALLRLVEVNSGRISIDGRDLSQIGLDALRSALSCIPQEPLLFEGTMRENLDPQESKTDAELNDVLGKCGLIARVDADEVERARLENFKLDASVATGGGDRSTGEGQLIALARAMAKGSSVILFDEATSAMDSESDASLQRVIKQHLGDNSTIICIAHRLATIAYYDKILVMDAGQVKEFASPLELWERPGSIFRCMSDAAGLTRQAFISE